MVYPALLAAVGDVAHPAWRATSVGVYRFWRDLGYAVGALMAGVVAALFGLVWAVHVAGILTALSGLLAWAQMSETLPGARMTVDDAALGTAAATRNSATP
jgi:MFS family permease